MYDNSVIASLLELIGFRGWHNTDVPALTATNSNSDSGEVYNSSDGIVSLDNINACMPVGIDFNTFLTNLKTDVITEGLKQVFAVKQLNRQTKPLLKDNYLYNGAGRIVDTITPEGRFVGYQIRMSAAEGLKVVIDEIWTQFTELQAVFPIRIFHSSAIDALKTVNLDRTKQNSVERHSLTGSDVINLYNVDDNHSTGGYFWIGYFEDELTGKAINRNKDISSTCTSCGENYATHRGGFLKVDPFYVTNGNLNGAQSWDEIYVNEVANLNFGLNFRMSVKCDLSEWVVRNKFVFIDVFKAVMKQKVLELYFNSNNINHLQGLSMDRVNHTLEQMSKNKEIENVINKANFQIEGNSPCFPPVKRNHVRYGSL